MFIETSTRPVKTVSEITSEISGLLENQFRFVRITGEISNIRRPLSGHYYFVLKDQGAQLNAVLFKNQQRFLAEEIREGLQVICDGRISVYEPRGQYQLIVDTVDFHGDGKLRIDFERLKEKLKSEGLFSADNKKELPSVIERVVLITSPSGAAVHDFLTTCRKRQASIHIKILPVKVQGEGSAEQISVAIDRAHELEPDVIVICRGGGSVEDLWAFNEEKVARAIYHSTIPVVTGIGHETDFTIADFCADVRAATPTAAAELLISDMTVLRRSVENVSHRLIRSLRWQIDIAFQRLSRARAVLSTFDTAFHFQTLKLDGATGRLIGSYVNIVQTKSEKYSRLDQKLLRLSPHHHIQLNLNQIKYMRTKLDRSMLHLLDSKQSAFQKSVAVLDSLSPLSTLSRGYAIVSKKDQNGERGKIVTSVEQVDDQETLDVRLHEGTLNCLVISRNR